MAYLKSESGELITLKARDYQTLINDHLTLRALRIAGIEKDPIFKAIEIIMTQG